MPTDPTPAEIATEVDAHIGSYMKLCEVLGIDPAGYDSTQAQTMAAEKIERMKREAAAIADALGARGLIDFADDVRMLTKL